MQKMIANEDVPWMKSQDRSNLSLMELTLDWPVGLELLCNYASNSSDRVEASLLDFQKAFKTACLTANEGAVTILLGSKRPVFAPDHKSTLHPKERGLWALDCAIRAAVDAASDRRERNPTRPDTWNTYLSIINLTVKELLDRRTKVNTLALQHLSRRQQIKFGISERRVLDDNAEMVFTALVNTTYIPAELDCCRMGSLYHGLEEDLSELWETEIFDTLFDAGFTAVDAQDKHGNTPLRNILQCAYKRPTIVRIAKMAMTIAWFLDRGAKCVSIANSNILFFAATAMDHFYSPDEDTSPEHGEKTEIKNLSDYSMLLVECICIAAQFETPSDSCECFCSTHGCIPPFDFWRCGNKDNSDEHSHCHNRLGRRMKTLVAWIKLLGTEKTALEQTYSELCRLEIFERLLMKHSCCSVTHVYLDDDMDYMDDMDYANSGEDTDNDENRDKAKDTDNSECTDSRTCAEPLVNKREKMGESSAESRQHLESLMSQYHKMREQHAKKSVDEFWHIWFEAVDEILPPLLPEEACRRKLVPKVIRRGDGVPYEVSREYFEQKAQKVLTGRQVRIRNALQKAGYAGIEYSEVIKVHFGQKYLAK